VACTRDAVFTPEQKRALGVRSKAVAVDMESAALAAGLGSRIPVIVLRAVSDSIDDNLPSEAGTFLDESGKVRLWNVARFALKRPWNVKTLMRLKRHSEAAAASLTAAWRAIAQNT
jgi:nucleoside phosphorylase